tara:strand:+ start:2299 stop:2643 length:345 start_codon:yes stop_codon:yes gene_type:complete
MHAYDDHNDGNGIVKVFSTLKNLWEKDHQVDIKHHHVDGQQPEGMNQCLPNIKEPALEIEDQHAISKPGQYMYQLFPFHHSVEVKIGWFDSFFNMVSTKRWIISIKSAGHSTND